MGDLRLLNMFTQLRNLNRSRTAAREIVTLISGKPGGGKGTMCKKLIKDFDCHHISTGDILRKHVSQGTPIGLQAKAFMDDGQMVPTELVVDLVFDELSTIDLDKSIVLLDGFPRTLEQGNGFLSRQNIDIALNIIVPDEEIVRRASMRWIHPDSGRVYAYDYNPPKEEGKDDETGEPLVQRDDEKTLPLNTLMDEKGVYAEFNGFSQPDLLAADKRSDAIYAELKPYFEAKLAELGYKQRLPVVALSAASEYH